MRVTQAQFARAVNLTRGRITQLKTELNATQYQRDRGPIYPKIGDQLDALYHAGVYPDGMAAQLKAVKDKYPKP